MKNLFLSNVMKGISTALLCICSLGLMAQTVTVKGVVTDAKTNEPIIGASVVVESNASTGTITDIDGRFELPGVPSDGQLHISYVGMKSLTVDVQGRTTINIQLAEDAELLQELVVVGYGTQQKKDITGSVAVIDTKELMSSSGSSATQQLQGRAAGVQIGSSGAPGSATMVRIRGINTVNDNGPLFVIDGVSTRNQDLSSLNPNDIESMQILKDASSAAIYGAQAANGVILITTKKGSKGGQPRLQYDGYFGVSQTATRYHVLNAHDRIDIDWRAQKSALDLSGATALGKLPSHPQFGTTSDSFVNHLPNYLTVKGSEGRKDIDPNSYTFPDNIITEVGNTDWWDEMDRTGWMQSHQLGLSGGTDKGQYSMSLNYFDQQGTVIESYFKRYQVRVNSSYNVRPWLRFGENLTYGFNKSNGLNFSGTEATPYSWTYRASPFVPVYDIKGRFAGSKMSGSGNFMNPVAQRIRNKDNYSASNRVFGNIWGELDLMKGLTFHTSFGLDYTNWWGYYITKKDLEFSESPKQNIFTEQANFNYRWVWTNTLAYKAKWDDSHQLDLLLGTEAIRDGMGRSFYGRRYNYLFEDNPDTWTLAMGENNGQRVVNSWYNGEMALFGMFFRADYSYRDRYLLTGIVRRDGVSRFSKSNRFGTFPSVSFGWRVSEEAFLANSRTWLDDLKLRVGYGQAGNAEIPVATNFINLYTTSITNTNYDLIGQNTGENTGYTLGSYGNSDTKWESTNMVNVGVDLTFLNNRFSTTLEWYHKKTSNMLIQAAYSSIAGEASAPYINYGDIQNTGVDWQLNYHDRRGDWAWDVSLNLSHYRNKVLNLSSTSDEYALWSNGVRLNGYVTKTTKGHPISEFWGYQLNGFYESVDDVKKTLPIGSSTLTDEEAKKFIGKFRFADLSGPDGKPDGRLDEKDRTFIGSPHPDLTGGLNTSVTYRDFDFTMFWNFSVGNQLFNNTKYFTDFWTFNGNKSVRMRDQSWTPGADNSKAILPILDYSDKYSGTYSNSYYVEEASFLRLKNLAVGYSLPKKLLRKATIENLRLYLQVENLLTFTRYSGLDPEFTNAYLRQSDSNDDGAGRVDLKRGVDMGGWPTTRRVLFGVNFTF